MSNTYTATEWAAMHDKLSGMTTAEQLASPYVNVTELPRSIYPEQVVTITHNGPGRIAVIKVLRTHLGIGLLPAKEMTDSVNYGHDVEVLSTPDVEAAQKLVTDLRNAGATVTLRGRE